jgi:acetyl/propionyl-CoA carboxylase alpha subunit/acetyl-CoA carboxylase carboxyltransferase component
VKTLRALEGSDLRAVALYTDVDRDAPFVRHADAAVRLPAAPGAEVRAYLDHDVVLAALRGANADAVWPGWGFVAEDPAFADRVAAEGLRFCGPSGDAMRALGDKIAAKQLAEAAGIPVAPWSGGLVADEAAAAEAAARIGYPLAVKAAAGGGGRGIRVVAAAPALEAAFRSAEAEARAAFGDGRLFLERLVSGARHVEVQIAGDAHGRVVALGARDCSVQRRHQKLIEEAPPPALPPALVARLADAATRLAQRVGYVGLGTVEFLVAGEEAYLLEMNPRLQVEHGITEEITGIDLVALQIRIARGESIAALRVVERGVAIEARVCAEDPEAAFAPAPGRIARFDPALGPGIRVDTGVAQGSVVPATFDSLIAKVIATGATRDEARTRLACALRDLDLVVEGGASNAGFLIDVLESEAFARAGIDTGWVDRRTREAGAADRALAADALVAAAILAYQRRRRDARVNFFVDPAGASPSRVPPSTGQEVDLAFEGGAYRLRVLAMGSWRYRVSLDDGVVDVTLREGDRHLARLELADRTRRVLYDATEVGLRLEVDGRVYRFGWATTGHVRATAPAVVVGLQVAVGDRVGAGQLLGFLEAMKVEIAFSAPVAGLVREIRAQRGQAVAAGEVLVVIEPQAESEGDGTAGARVTLAREPDALAPLFGGGGPDGRRAAVAALVEEARTFLIGYDADPARVLRLTALLEQVDPGALPPALRDDLAVLATLVVVFADLEQLFLVAPRSVAKGQIDPSNAARLRGYLRRVRAGGAGVAEAFLVLLRRALGHYGIASLAHDPALERALMRLFATQQEPERRQLLVRAILRCLVGLARTGVPLAAEPALADALGRVAGMRALVADALADAAIEAREEIFQPGEPGRPSEPRPAAGGDPSLHGLDPDTAARIGFARLSSFELERMPGAEDVYCFWGRSRAVPDDERLFVLAEVRGDDASTASTVAAFERVFLRATSALRTLRGARDRRRRLHWNRIFIDVGPVVRLGRDAMHVIARTLAPASYHLGLEKVVVRLRLAGDGGEPALMELVVSDPTGGRMEVGLRTPETAPLAPATDYERSVVEARRRRLVYPYEIVRLLLRGAPGATFTEHDLDPAAREPRAVPVSRQPGQNDAGLVFGIVSTPTEKVPEGMRRVLVLSDPTHGMGSLTAAECDRAVAAIDLAERERLPVEWIPISAGARIAMDSGTENLDATARVARRIITFTERGGVIHLVVYGVNVGAQSYWNALATMVGRGRGVLVMTPDASMVLTGVGALAASGAVSAEDEVALGGFERIMGPNGEAQYYAPDLRAALRTLADHYRYTYVVPGEPGPRRRTTTDPATRDVTTFPYRGDAGDGFATIGEIFDDATNPGRKRPFAMRAVMEALVDQDGGMLERWRSWVGAETAIVCDAHLGGIPVSLIGIESLNLAREGYRPPDGPASWSGGTLFPLSSKKVARALNAASGNRPAVVLANLSGFDGSPESLRKLQLEYGAEIARAVVRFDGPLLFLVVSRYHGGAYVVFSKSLNPRLRAMALSGSYASVIGGSAAAAVVLTREVRARAGADPAVRRAREALRERTPEATRAYERALADATRRAQAEVAAEFDAVHTVERACRVGSLDEIVDPRRMRAALIAALEAGGTSRGSA